MVERLVMKVCLLFFAAFKSCRLRLLFGHFELRVFE